MKFAESSTARRLLYEGFEENLKKFEKKKVAATVAAAPAANDYVDEDKEDEDSSSRSLATSCLDAESVFQFLEEPDNSQVASRNLESDGVQDLEAACYVYEPHAERREVNQSYEADEELKSPEDTDDRPRQTSPPLPGTAFDFRADVPRRSATISNCSSQKWTLDLSASALSLASFSRLTSKACEQTKTAQQSNSSCGDESQPIDKSTPSTDDEESSSQATSEGASSNASSNKVTIIANLGPVVFGPDPPPKMVVIKVVDEKLQETIRSLYDHPTNMVFKKLAAWVIHEAASLRYAENKHKLFSNGCGAITLFRPGWGPEAIVVSSMGTDLAENTTMARRPKKQALYSNTSIGGPSPAAHLDPSCLALKVNVEVTVEAGLSVNAIWALKEMKSKQNNHERFDNRLAPEDTFKPQEKSVLSSEDRIVHSPSTQAMVGEDIGDFNDEPTADPPEHSERCASDKLLTWERSTLRSPVPSETGSEGFKGTTSDSTPQTTPSRSPRNELTHAVEPASVNDLFGVRAVICGLSEVTHVDLENVAPKAGVNVDTVRILPDQLEEMQTSVDGPYEDLRKLSRELSKQFLQEKCEQLQNVALTLNLKFKENIASVQAQTVTHSAEAPIGAQDIKHAINEIEGIENELVDTTDLDTTSTSDPSEYDFAGEFSPTAGDWAMELSGTFISTQSLKNFFLALEVDDCGTTTKRDVITAFIQLVQADRAARNEQPLPKAALTPAPFIKSAVLRHTTKLGIISLQSFLDRLAFDEEDRIGDEIVFQAFKDASAEEKAVLKQCCTGKLGRLGPRLGRI